MTITRVGTSQKYADGWSAAFKAKAKGEAGSKKAAPSKKAKPKKGAKKGKR
jgi:hypothetical protein